MIRRLYLTVWFICVLCAIPIGILATFLNFVVEYFIFCAAFALAPFMLATIEYIFTGETKYVRAIFSGEKI